MTAKREETERLIARIREICRGYYTETDGGDWYVVAPNAMRLAEGFIDRNDARRCLCWLAGDAMPEGWSVERSNDLFVEVRIKNRQIGATIWRREAELAFPFWKEFDL